MFEASLYESFDSLSALGGVLAITAWEWENSRDRLLCDLMAKCRGTVDRSLDDPLLEGEEGKIE